MQSTVRHGLAITGLALVVCVSGCTVNTGADSAGTGLCDGSVRSATVDDATMRPLAFSSDRSGSFDLWLMRPDGSDAVQLTNAPGAEGMASWSPDGTRLVFMSAADLESPGDICVVNADGTGLRHLTDTADVFETTPSWSPDGTEIVYGTWSGDVHEIHVMDSDGGGSRRVASTGNWPSWSPDGERIVFSAGHGGSGQGLWTINRDGSGLSLLADGVRELAEPAWSPDGEAIAFVSASGDPSAADPVKWNEDIFVMDAAGGPGQQITTLPGNDHWPPAWSPNGRQLAFTADGKENVGEILVVDLTSLAVTNLTNSEADDAFPAWRR